MQKTHTGRCRYCVPVRVWLTAAAARLRLKLRTMSQILSRAESRLDFELPRPSGPVHTALANSRSSLQQSCANKQHPSVQSVYITIVIIIVFNIGKSKHCYSITFTSTYTICMLCESYHHHPSSATYTISIWRTGHHFMQCEFQF